MGKAETDGSDVVDQCIRNFNERRLGLGPPEISTGIKALDRAIIGLRPKNMYVLAARPSMGKTALADTIRRAVVNQGYIVCEFSLEMGADEIGERELAYQSKLNLRKVMSGGGATDAEAARINDAAGTVPKGLWFVYDNCFSMDTIVAKSREAKARADDEGKKIGLITIDYLQLLSDQGNEGRQQSVSACSRMTKQLSAELDTAVLALSQLNRNCEFREDKRPMLSDLRESGSIEQDANLAMFLYRDHVYNQSVSPEAAELIIRKQRSGPTGTVHVKFNPATVHFSDLDPSSVSEIDL